MPGFIASKADEVERKDPATIDRRPPRLIIPLGISFPSR
jgi:hypothetical protein